MILKRIINVDQMKTIGYFSEDETDQKIRELEKKGFKDVSTDRDGDITVWEE